MTKILIVDDNENNRAVLADALYDEPYDLQEAADGRQALELVRTEIPDLILLDIMMPGMDGIAVLRELHSKEETQEIPVIIVSALGNEAQVLACFEEGAIDHVAKPFSNAVVRARIRSALRSHCPELGDAEINGKTIGFIGAKGGVGTTTVALNIALILQQRQETVNALEFHPSYGTFSTQLGMTPDRNLSQLSLTTEPITSESLKPLLFAHPTGLRILFGPQPDDGYVELLPQLAEDLVVTMNRLAAYTIMDVAPFPSAANLAALSHCDQVVLVLGPNASSLATGVAMKRHLTESCDPGKFAGVIVVRQSVSSTSLTANQIESFMGCPVLGLVLPDPDVCCQALKSGKPLTLSHPDNLVSTALREIVQKLYPAKAAAAVM